MRDAKQRRAEESIQLNLTAMLDMAFQLLAFFILTFRPPPIEGEVRLRVPPPLAPDIGTARPGTEPVATPKFLDNAKTLVVTVFAEPEEGTKSAQRGRIADMAVGIGQNYIPLGRDKGALRAKLRELCGDDSSPFEQVILQSDSRLRYAEWMSIVEICTQPATSHPHNSRQRGKLPKLSFVELPAELAAAR